jgi:hypothetical protein
MKQTETNKLKRLVKNNTQKEAIAEFLSAGHEFTIDEARSAGIADPRRVVNSLRTEHGLPIAMNETQTRRGVVRKYVLAQPTKASKGRKNA